MLSAVIDVPASRAELLSACLRFDDRDNLPDNVDVFAMDLGVLLRKPPICGNCSCRTREDDVRWTVISCDFGDLQFTDYCGTRVAPLHMIGKTTYRELGAVLVQLTHLVELLVRPALMCQPAGYRNRRTQDEAVRQLWR